MLVLVLPPVSSRVIGFMVASPCLWGKLQNLSFCHVANCENWRKSGTKCWFFCIHVSRLESPVFLVASPCLRGKLENLSSSNVSKQVVKSFCVAGVALCDIPSLFGNVSEVSKLEEVWHEMLVFLHPRLVSSLRFFLVASPCLWGKLRKPPHYTVSTLLTPHLLHSTLYTTLCTLRHSSLYTLIACRHSTLYTLHSTPHSTLLTLYTPHSTLYTPHFTLHTLHSSLYTLRSTLYTLQSRLYTLHSALHTLHFTLYAPHFTFYTPHSTLYTFHSTLHIPH